MIDTNPYYDQADDNARQVTRCTVNSQQEVQIIVKGTSGEVPVTIQWTYKDRPFYIKRTEFLQYQNSPAEPRSH